jgi:8-oxo-dGTP pyrophosphatase MutT (NUDIX family)
MATAEDHDRSTMRHIVNALFVRNDAVLLARRSLRRSAYGGLWSFVGGHVEDGESLSAALLRESQEEAGVIPTGFSFLASISDPNAPQIDPVIYHLYAVTAWEGGEPHPVGDEHTEFRWFSPTEAMALRDLALQEYQPIFKDMVGSRRSM